MSEPVNPQPEPKPEPKVFADYSCNYFDVPLGLSRPNLNTEKSYTVYLEGRHRDGMMRHMQHLPAAILKEQFSEFWSTIATGQYHWMAPKCVDSWDSPECMEELLYYVVLQKPETSRLPRATFHEICGGESKLKDVNSYGQPVPMTVLQELRSAFLKIVFSPNFTTGLTTPLTSK